MKNFRAIIAMLLVLLVTSPSFAAVGIKKDGTLNTTATDLNFTSIGNTITTDGSTATFNLVLAGAKSGGVTSATSLTTAVSTSYSLIKKVITTNSDAAFTAGTLADGIPGQILTIEVIGSSPTANTTGNFTLTPTTKSGFTSIKMTALRDVVTLLWADNNTGWIIINAFGSVTINF